MSCCFRNFSPVLVPRGGGDRSNLFFPFFLPKTAQKQWSDAQPPKIVTPPTWKIVPNTTKQNQELLLGEKMFGNFFFFSGMILSPFSKVFFGGKKKRLALRYLPAGGRRGKVTLQGKKKGKANIFSRFHSFSPDRVFFPLFIPSCIFFAEIRGGEKGGKFCIFPEKHADREGKFNFSFLFISAHPRCGEWGEGQ